MLARKFYDETVHVTEVMLRMHSRFCCRISIGKLHIVSRHLQKCGSRKFRLKIHLTNLYDLYDYELYDFKKNCDCKNFQKLAPFDPKNFQMPKSDRVSSTRSLKYVAEATKKKPKSVVWKQLHTFQEKQRLAPRLYTFLATIT